MTDSVHVWTGPPWVMCRAGVVTIAVGRRLYVPLHKRGDSPPM